MDYDYDFYSSIVLVAIVGIFTMVILNKRLEKENK